MSLLLAEGHPHARHYPLAFLWSEARLAKRRIKGQIGVQVLGFYTAAATAVAGGKGLKEFIESLGFDE